MSRIIDYQPTQVTSIRSMDQDVLVDHVVHLARFGILYRLPIVLPTVNVTTRRNQGITSFLCWKPPCEN